MKRVLLRTILLAVMSTAFGFCAVAGPVTIYIASHGNDGPFESNYFALEGVTFNSGYSVISLYPSGPTPRLLESTGGNVQSIIGYFHPGISSLLVNFVPITQGTAVYTLLVFDSSSNLLVSSSLTATTPPPFQSLTIGLPMLPALGVMFRLESRNIVDPNSSSGMPFGISSLTFDQVPEPATVVLLAVGGGLLAILRRRRVRN